MLKYTICFIRQGERILLLNREKPPWMGAWNGVGGKIEPAESVEDSILREVREETGLVLDSIQFKGIVTWSVDVSDIGGMYTYTATLPLDQVYEVPLHTPEGLLDWKELQWILHPANKGVASSIPKMVERLYDDPACYEHRCGYRDGQLTDYQAIPLEGEVSYPDGFRLKQGVGYRFDPK